MPSESWWHFMTLFCLLWELPFIAQKQFLFYSFPASGSKPVLEVCLTNPYETSQFKTPCSPPCWTLKATGTVSGLPFHLISPAAFVLSFYLYCSVKVKTYRDNFLSSAVWCGLEHFWQFLLWSVLLQLWVEHRFIPADTETGFTHSVLSTTSGCNILFVP